MVVGSLPNRGPGHIDWEMARVSGNSTVLVTSRSQKLPENTVRQDAESVSSLHHDKSDYNTIFIVNLSQINQLRVN